MIVSRTLDEGILGNDISMAHRINSSLLATPIIVLLSSRIAQAILLHKKTLVHCYENLSGHYPRLHEIFKADEE